MKLKRIRLPIAAHDKRIDSRRSYLIRYEGNWVAGKWTKQWYGWNFDGFYDAGIQHDCPGIQAVYEINSR